MYVGPQVGSLANPQREPRRRQERRVAVGGSEAATPEALRSRQPSGCLDLFWLVPIPRGFRHRFSG
jgi:hypothetical protein